jgi:hypothetical protein
MTKAFAALVPMAFLHAAASAGEPGFDRVC